MVDQSSNNLTVFSELPGFADHHVPIYNTGIFHGISFNPQGKKVISLENLWVHNNSLFPFLLGIKRKTCCNRADNRNNSAFDACFSVDAILSQNADGPAVFPLPFDKPFSLKNL